MSHSIATVTSEATWPLLCWCPKCNIETRARRQWPECNACGCADVTYRQFVQPVRSTEPPYRPWFSPRQQVYFLRDGQIVEAVVVSCDDPETGIVRLYCEGQKANRPSVHHSRLFSKLEFAQEAQDAYWSGLPTVAETIINRPSTPVDDSDYQTYVDGWAAPATV